MDRYTRRMMGVAAVAIVALAVIVSAPASPSPTTIDVYNVSGGNAAFYGDASYIYYEGEELEHRFRLYGVADGTPFTATHEVTGERFRVDTTITAGNGVKEGFVVPRPRDGTLTVSFFVDEEFRAAAGTHITYGSRAESVETPSWREVGDGVYQATITYGDLTTLANRSRVPVFLGSGVPGQDTNITGIGIY